jgi:hypothetical protein
LDLVTKDLVEEQDAYLLVALRQRILSLLQAYARRLLESPTKGNGGQTQGKSLSIPNE